MVDIFHSHVHTFARENTRTPLPLTPLIGRQEEVERLQVLLQDREIRLVTISGPAGVGKTHLALKLVSLVATSFEDGVFFVDLATVDDPDKVISSLAHALGIQEVSDSFQPMHLHTFFSGKRLLLLLDNFEHLLDAAPLLTELLSVYADLTIVVTSRATLGIHGEYEFRLYPLALPENQRGPQTSQELEQCASVQLFLQRARAANALFRLTPANAADIAEICIHLDGLPLALEMAAARTRLFSVNQLLQLMQRKLQFLTSDLRDLPARQQTWRGTVRWSYELLSQEEQKLFRLCSIFKGICSLEALAALTGNTPIEIMDGVMTLLSSSLVQQHVLPGGEIALKMLSTLRDYGLELLATHAELEQTQIAYVRYYQQLALEAERHLAGPEKQSCQELLQREYENIQAAIYWLMRQEREQEALCLGKVLYLSSLLRHHILEEFAWLERIFSNYPYTRLSAQARGLYYLGSSAFFSQNFLEARSYLETSLSIYQELPTALAQAQANCILGHVHFALRDYEKAKKHVRAAMHVLKEEQAYDAQEENGYAFMLLALIALHQQDCEKAAEYAGDAVRCFKGIESRRGEASSLCVFASAQTGLQEITKASEYLREALNLARQLNHRPLIVSCANLLGATLAIRGSLPQAVMLWSAADTLRRESQEEGLYAQNATLLLPPDAHGDLMEQARVYLGGETFELWWKKGTHMRIEQVLEESRVETKKSSPVRQLSPNHVYLEQLTAREREILQLVATGLTDAQVAQKLVISPRTVGWHLSTIYRKIHVNSRSAATLYAVEHHIRAVSPG